MNWWLAILALSAAVSGGQVAWNWKYWGWAEKRTMILIDSGFFLIFVLCIVFDLATN